MNTGTMRSHLRILLLVALFISAGSLALGREVGARFAAAAGHSTQHTSSGTQRAGAPVALVYAQITGELGTPTPHHTSKPTTTSPPAPESGSLSTDSVLDVTVTDSGPQCGQGSPPTEGSPGRGQGQDQASQSDGQSPGNGPHDGRHESGKGIPPDCTAHGRQDASTTTISATASATVTSVSISTSISVSTSTSVAVVSITTQP
ncbi:MAG TPA: hypothetical protein VF807_07695 [Ktedonobacterales bacterium]